MKDGKIVAGVVGLQFGTQHLKAIIANGYEVVDIFDLSQYHAEWFEKDNVHPSADGARSMAETIAKKITGK